MQESLFSQQWYRVAQLSPRLRSNVTTSRHYYRGVVWYVVAAKSGKTRLRINSSAFHLLSELDGQRSVEEIWRDALVVLGDDTPSQSEVIQLLATLFDAGLIDFQKQTDVDRLFDSRSRQQSREQRSRYLNPLFLRFSLFDPDALTQRLIPYAAWIFSRPVLYAWLVALLGSALLAGFHAAELSASVASSALAPAGLLTFWIVFPLMKAIHELAHGLAVKRWGGEVHEFGIALLILLPVPYVDASESSTFGSKYRRMAVAGAGIFAETTLACIALGIWATVEPGLVRDTALCVFITGTVSSLLFNGNPLLKFDGYYVLSDLIEIPSLASRSNQYLRHLVKRYLIGIESRSPVTARGERVWFVSYGVLAFCYRIFLTIGICLLVGSKYFFIGVVLAFWSLGLQFVMPLLNGVKFLLFSADTQASRLRSVTVATVGAAVFAALFFFTPLPNATHARGVVWPVDDAMVRAEADCLVEAVMTTNGDRVESGEPLIRCETTLLEAELRDLEAERLAKRAELFGTRDRVQRGLIESDLEALEDLIAAAERRLAGGVLEARASGDFFAHDAENLVGRFFAQGDVIGYMLESGNVAVRTLLDQDRVLLLDERLVGVEIFSRRTADGGVDTSVTRRVPAATQTLITAALGAAGGGDLRVSQSDGEGMTLEEAAFEVEVVLPDELQTSLVGEAVSIRFDHGSASIAQLLYRETRLLLLRRFNV